MRRVVKRGIALAMVLVMVAAVLATLPMCVSASTTIYIRPDGSVDPETAPIERAALLPHILTETRFFSKNWLLVTRD